MATNDDGAKSEAGSAKPGGRRRSAVTLDLSADEIKRDEPDQIDADKQRVPVTTAAESAAMGGTMRNGPQSASPPPDPVGWLRLVAFAIIGAVVVLIGGYLLMATNLLPSPGRQDAEDALAATQRLAADVEALQQTAANNQALDLGPLTARIDALEQLAAGLGDLGQTVDTLAADLVAAQTTQANIAADLDDLRRELVAGAAAAGNPQAAAQLAQEIDALSTRLTALEGAGPPAALTALQQQLDQLQMTVANLTNQTEELAANAEGRDRAADAARLLAFNNVRAAAERGAAFTDELAILRELGVDADALATLDAAAAAGVPSRAELADMFDDVAEAVLTATSEPDPDAGFWDRLLENARGIVTVTPTVPIEGDTPAAILSRMRAAVEAGDIETALVERQGLPEAGLAASADWAADAAARVALDAAMDDLAAAVQRRPAG